MTPVEAWAAVIAAEDAAIYAYSIAGARVASADRRRARAGLDAHRSRRARALVHLSALGGTPPGGAGAYTLPDNIRRPRIAAGLLADVDLGLVAVYADAAAATEGEDRRWAARAAADCAVSSVSWGAESQAFPTVPATSV